MHYDSDYDIPESPQLQAVHVKAKPSPPPPPFIPRPPRSPVRLSPPSRREQKQRGRRFKPSLGDEVLLGFMGPSNPEVAREASKVPLAPGSDFEVSDSEMDDRPESRAKRNTSSRPTTPADPKVDIARQVAELLHAQTSEGQGDARSGQSADARPRQDKLSPSAPLDIVNLQISALEPDGSEARRPGTSGSAMVVDVQSPDGHPPESDSLATSPQLREHTIPDSEGAPTEKLPALYSPHPSSTDGGPSSPNQIRPLPAFAELNKLAEAASHDQDSRANGYPHRQSISSANGQQLPILSQISPVSTNGDTPAGDGWKHLPMSPNNMPPTPNGDRRYSLASDIGPSPHALPPPSRPSPENQEVGASTHPTPADPAQMQRMSIDAKTRVLPLPISSMGAGVAFPATTTGSYRCDFPGCNVPPFQTQYLLNSHANVHSQNRPHYCPVRGCPRGEGGRGFKRKNEMIRHGLVHDSPGYVCPFCPEREHRYPRPDNLQRHVRVHHVDKDKDDAALRDVLAQRPEGPSRGRRRRVGS